MSDPVIRMLIFSVFIPLYLSADNIRKIMRVDRMLRWHISNIHPTPVWKSVHIPCFFQHLLRDPNPLTRFEFLREVQSQNSWTYSDWCFLSFTEISVHRYLNRTFWVKNGVQSHCIISSSTFNYLTNDFCIDGSTESLAANIYQEPKAPAIPNIQITFYTCENLNN